MSGDLLAGLLAVNTTTPRTAIITLIGSHDERPLPATPQSSKAWRHGLPFAAQPSSQSPGMTSPRTPLKICLTDDGQPSTASLAEPRQPASDPSQLSSSCCAQPKLYKPSIQTISLSFWATSAVPPRLEY